MPHFCIGEGKFVAPAAKDAAEAFQQAAQQIMDRDPLFREKLFGAVFVHDAGRQNCYIGMGLHIVDHTGEQGWIKSHIRIHDQMVFALQQRQHSVIGSAEADVSFLGKDIDTGKQPLNFFGSQVLGRVVGQEHIHLKIGILNTPQGMSQFVPAVIQHDTGGKDRGHPNNLRRHDSVITGILQGPDGFVHNGA